jgi:hypothetical protein
MALSPCTKREPLADYLANREYVSSSQLRRLARLGRRESAAPAAVDFDGSRMGEALHALVLEPEAFASRYRVLDGSVPAKRYGSGIQAMQRTWLDAWQWTALNRARAAILACPQAPLARWLSHGQKELSIYWTDESGRKWKARPDCFTDEGVVMELKTTTDCRPEAFARTRERLAYDVQAAHYVEAVFRLTGRRPLVVYVAVDFASPCGVWVHELSEAQVRHAAARLEKLKAAFSCATLART